jgi:hypothetical protein
LYGNDFMTLPGTSVQAWLTRDRRAADGRSVDEPDGVNLPVGDG